MSAARCDRCGRFYRYGEPGSSWMFVPDSHVSYEECCMSCADCTEKHGPPVPVQAVRLESCCGVVPEGESRR